MDNSDSSKGLFGYISGTGTVKNVVLTDANFVGHQNIGGLVGYIDSNGSVTDCYLYHVRVEGNSNTSRSVVVGNQGGTATRTHYRDCCEYRLDGSSSKNIYRNSIFTLTPDANVVLPARTGWHTLDGRPLDGKPTARGLYIVNGKKVVVK